MSTATSRPVSKEPATDGPSAEGTPAEGLGVEGPGARDGMPETARQAARARWRRWRWVLAVTLVVGLAALVAAVTGSVAGDQDRLGPANPGPEGSRALVQVLRAQGVDVQPARRSAAAVAATGAGSTLLVTGTGLLGPDQLDRLAADDATDLVLVEPDEIALSRLAPRIHAAGTAEAATREPGCALPAARAAGSARAGGRQYVIESDPGAESTGSDLCYPEATGSGSYLVEQQSGRTVTVIGQSDLLTNEYLDAGGNAALALWSTGERPSLVWYAPDPLEPTNGEPATLTSLLPGWVGWVLAQLAVAVVVAILWRARRFAPLVPEPLPVIVRAAETQEGRARLYRQASARGRAAATLRTTTLRRLAGRLAAPSGTTPEQLVTLVAAATGGNEPALQALLLGPAPESDAALVRLADDLDTVERDLEPELSRDRPVRSN